MMSIKRSIAEGCLTVGTIPMICILQFTPYGGGNPLHCLWALPIGLITLPLLPLGMWGDRVIREYELADFAKETAHLPHVKLPEHYAYIDNDKMEKVKSWYAIIDYTDEGFYECSSEEDAKTWLISKGYEEVVALDFPTAIGTYWIKKENNNG
jgi:hypothetical protein